jgi:flagellar hook-length control protein FliK
MTPTITTTQSLVGTTQPVSPVATGNVAQADFMMLLAQIVGQPAQQAITPLATPMTSLPRSTSDLVESEDIAQPDAAELLALALPFIGRDSAFDAQTVSSGGAMLNGMTQRIEQNATRAAFDVQLVTDMIQGKQVATSEVTIAEGDVFQLPIASPESAQAHKAHAASDMISRPIHVPVGNAQWADELGARLTTMTEQGRHAASLRLSPEHLGPLEIRISIRDDQASVWFGAAHADTRAAIEHALPRLRDMFEAQGMSLADAGVFHEAPREQPHCQANKASADSHTSSADEPTSIPVRVNIGLVDAYA